MTIVVVAIVITTRQGVPNAAFTTALNDVRLMTNALSVLGSKEFLPFASIALLPQAWPSIDFTFAISNCFY